MTPEEFREAGHRLIDWLADYRTTLHQRPVQSRTPPGAIKASLPTSPPEAGESFEQIFPDLDQLIVPGLTLWQHPAFFGYFPSASPLSSVLGDFLSTGLGVLGLSWQSSPALTELEEVVCDWLRQMVGLSDAWSGVIQDTASASTLVALICARERSTGLAMARGGLWGEPAPLVVYASEQAHSSVTKAALLAGFGREYLRLIPTDPAFALDPERLRATVQADLAAGLLPCAVIATTGTTASTAFDPLAAVASVASEHELWMHVDAAMAGSAMILPECRPLWEGIEGADSVVLNPHKWLGAVFDCSVYYVKDAEHLVRVMSTNPSYLRTAEDGQVKNYRDWGIPLGRRFRALKLWTLIRCEGVERLRIRLRRDIENARWLAEQVRQAEHWRVVAPVTLQTVCLRHEPIGMSAEALDTHNQGWADRLNRSGDAYVTPALLGGRWMVRVSVGSEATERREIEALWARMRREVG